MNTTPKDRAEAIRRLSEFNADGATEDDILCGIIRMEYYRIPYGPDAVRDRFPAFYRAAIGLFDDWKFVLSRAGLHVRPSRYFEPLSPDAALHSENAYRSAVAAHYKRLRSAGRRNQSGGCPHVTLPIFHTDLPAVLCDSTFTRQWLEMNHRLFPDLFRQPGISSEWCHADSRPHYTLGGLYYLHKVGFIRRFLYKKGRFCVIFYELPEETP